MEPPPGVLLRCRTCTIGRSVARQAASSAAMLRSASGLLRTPHVGSSNARWTSITMSALARGRVFILCSFPLSSS